MKIHISKVLISLLVVIFLGQLFLAPSYAQIQDDEIGITVTPITDEFTIEPGEVISRTITVINPGEEVITLYPQTLNFSTDNENGQPVFFSGQDDSASYTLSSWVTFEKEFIRIAKNEEEQVRIIISAPRNAEPGGHYGAVLFSTEKPELANLGTTEVSVVGLVGTLLLATVPGAIIEKLELEQFNLPLIAFSSPIELDQVYKNKGNIHLKPIGEIVVKNWSGNQTGILFINEGRGNVLPQSRRRFSESWSFDPLRVFGIYTFVLQSSYGSTLTELNATKKVLIIPYWILIIITLALLYGGYKYTQRRKTKRANTISAASKINKPPPILR